MKSWNFLFLFLLLIIISEVSYSETSPKTSPPTVIEYSIRPGEVKFIKFKKTEKKPTLICRDQSIPLGEIKDLYVGIVSESYFSKDKDFNCSLKYSDNTEKKIKFTVNTKEFPHETLSVAKGKVKPSTENQKQIDDDRKVADNVYSHPLDSLQIKEPFKAPLNSKITSPYGIKRTFNNGLKQGEHLGIDFRGSEKTKIPAANRGKVVLARKLFLSGNVVIIDHGIGIFTQYHHMSKIVAKEGEMVELGQTLGFVGSTGRVSGPHLHWGSKVQGNMIDASQLTEESKSLFNSKPSQGF